VKVRDFDILEWLQGKRKMSQALGMFGLLDSRCYGLFLLGALFGTYEPIISLIFHWGGGLC
jgi:hypothetical protein